MTPFAETPEVKEPAHADRGHHPTSPSSTQTLEASPCFQNKSGPGGEAALRGTKQHEAADRGSDDADLSDEEAFAVTMTMDAVNEAIRELGGDTALILKEEYWNVDEEIQFDGHGNPWVGTTGGFADVVVVTFNWSRAIVLDWKFGKYSVEPAETNLQGISYALGVFHRAKKMGHVMEEVTVAFFSPHLNEFTQHTFKASDVPDMLLRVRVTVARAKEARRKIAADPTDMSAYEPRTTSCTFCGRIGVCPAVAKIALKVSQKYKPLDQVPEDIRGLALLDPKIAQFGLQLSQVLAAWASEYRTRVTNKAVDSVEFIPDGYMLMMTHPRKVVNVPKALEIAANWIPKEDLEGMLSLPLGPMEKAVESTAPRGQKKIRSEAFAEELEVAGAVTKSPTPVISLRMKNEKKTE